MKMHAAVWMHALLLPIGAAGVPARVSGEVQVISAGQQEFGRINPKAPAALSQFAFLVGRWHCDARFRVSDGSWQKLQAIWTGRFILDGFAIADEYRMSGPSGDPIVLGVNIRSYDIARGTWSLRWLDGLSGRWVDLAPEELGGVAVSDSSIVYAFREPVADHRYTRATYTDIGETRFTWRGERSDDARTWSEFMVVDCVAASR